MIHQFLESVLKDDVQDFIGSNEQSDIQQLLLKHKTIHQVPTSWIAQQILGRRKARYKLPSWYATKGIVYPPSLNLEQSSSEATAKFKASLLQGGGYGGDLTGGFGVDTYFLSQRHPKHYVEPNEDLLRIVKHNHSVLGATNITYHLETAETFLQSARESFGFLFLDPSRRKATRKVYKLEDCEPNIIKLQTGFFSRSDRVLLKTSPLYDLMQGCRELQNVAQIVVVAVENECKELLFMLVKNFSGEPEIRAVDLYPKEDTVNSVSFSFQKEKDAVSVFSSPLRYLYEPNVAILKAGAFKWISAEYKVFKLAPSTHLYTSDDVVDFPGRVFKIREFVRLDRKLKDHFPNGYVNMIVRNYPLSVEEIKKKTGLKEGGELYLLCTQTDKEKFAIVAERVK